MLLPPSTETAECVARYLDRVRRVLGRDDPNWVFWLQAATETLEHRYRTVPPCVTETVRVRGQS